MKKLNVGDRFHSFAMDDDGKPHWYIVREVTKVGYVIEDCDGIEKHTHGVIHNLFEREDHPWTLKRGYKFELEGDLFEI